MCVSDRRTEVVVAGVTEVVDRKADIEERLSRLDNALKLSLESVAVRSIEVQVTREPARRSKNALTERSASLEQQRAHLAVLELSREACFIEKGKRVNEHYLVIGYVDVNVL